MHQELFYVPGTTVTDKELFLFTRNYFNVPGTRTTFVFLSYKWAPKTEWNHWCVLYLGSVASTWNHERVPVTIYVIVFLTCS
jgi:hypothetical protein